MIRYIVEHGSFTDIVATFVALAIITAFVLSLIFIIVGGIAFILSAGHEEKIKKSIHTIRFAIVGFIITFLATIVVSWISRILGIEFNISFGLVLALVKELARALQ
jgi:hypothetical protein